MWRTDELKVNGEKMSMQWRYRCWNLNWKWTFKMRVKFINCKFAMLRWGAGWWICLYSSADIHQFFHYLQLHQVILSDKFDVYFLTQLEWKTNSSFFPHSAKIRSLMMLWWIPKFLLEVNCQPLSPVCVLALLFDGWLLLSPKRNTS